MNDGATPRAVRPYVTDEDFRRAMAGHESEALSMLGISASTSLQNASLQADDIAGAAMKSLDLDYAQVKLMITKHILHREDLVRTTAAAAPEQAASNGSRSEPQLSQVEPPPDALPRNRICR